MRLRKFLIILMVLALCLPMSVWAEEVQTGTITIETPAKDQTYKLYRMFDLTSYSEGKYAYTVHSGWEGFFAQGQPGAAYITLENGHPTWTQSDETGAPDFARKAIAYAESKGLTPEKSFVGQGSVVQLSVPFGYYVLSSSLGTMCSLATTTTEPNVTIAEKNVVPGVVKSVKNTAHTGEDFGISNTAAIGDVLEFRSEITVGQGNYGFLYHDKAVGMDISNIAVQDAGDGKFTITENPGDGCTFHIDFDDTFLTGRQTIVITYTGTLNASAVIQGNGTELDTNTARLDYNDTKTVDYVTRTATYSFSLKKTDEAGNQLPLAHFRLYKTAEGDTEIPLVKDGTKGYRPAIGNEQGEEIITDGSPVRIFGLDSAQYYLEETKAPEGFYARSGRILIDLKEKIDADNFSPEYTVENKPGTKLPSTGGVGTTVFYVAGVGLMALATVLLVQKRRK